MATAQLDTLVDISFAKSKGFVTALKRSVQVTALTGSAANTIAEQILAATNMPVSGATITVGDDELYLEEISGKLRSGEQTIADVTLGYVRNQLELSASGGTVPVFSGGTSLKQVQTPFDSRGNQITVEHTWPADDPDWPNRTDSQSGVISVSVPMTAISSDVVITTTDAIAISQSWEGYVNSNTWKNGAARTWMCTQCDFILIQSPSKFNFSFTFEYDKETWDNDTTAIFIDPRTSKPPENLVKGVGIKPIDYAPQRYFSNTF